MLDKKTAYGIFKTTVAYIFSKYVHCDMKFLDVKIGALFCFLNGFGIAVPVIFFRNIQLANKLYNLCTRLRPTKCYIMI